MKAVQFCWDIKKKRLEKAKRHVLMEFENQYKKIFQLYPNNSASTWFYLTQRTFKKHGAVTLRSAHSLVSHECNPCGWKVEAEGSGTQDQPCLQWVGDRIALREADSVFPACLSKKDQTEFNAKHVPGTHVRFWIWSSALKTKQTNKNKKHKKIKKP